MADKNNDKISAETSEDNEPPINRPEDHYLTEDQLRELRRILVNQKRELLQEARGTVGENIAPIDEAGSDFADMASHETERDFVLRLRDRERKLINKIDQALNRIDEGDYGYCEVTGDPIGFNRLKARPVATVTIEVKEAQEEEERRRRM